VHTWCRRRAALEAIIHVHTGPCQPLPWLGRHNARASKGHVANHIFRTRRTSVAGRVESLHPRIVSHRVAGCCVFLSRAAGSWASQPWWWSRNRGVALLTQRVAFEADCLVSDDLALGLSSPRPLPSVQRKCNTLDRPRYTLTPAHPPSRSDTRLSLPLSPWRPY